jgi:hypothetical protein
MGDDFVKFNNARRLRKEKKHTKGMILWNKYIAEHNVKILKEWNRIIEYEYNGGIYYYTELTHKIREKGSHFSFDILKY